jgi:hypothetical protein
VPRSGLLREEEGERHRRRFSQSPYEKDEAYAENDPDIRSVKILQRYDSDLDGGSGDEDHQGYVD